MGARSVRARCCAVFCAVSAFRALYFALSILAAAKESGADVLYSEDLDTGTNYDGLKVINPF